MRACHSEIPATKQSGFTLIELVVVIAIMGLLVSILLPAVQGARAASRRIQCLSNLHQIGLAVHNYQASWAVFPSTKKWKSQLRSYVEQTDDSKRIPLFACPSDTFGTGEIGKLQVSYQPCEGVRIADQDGYAGRGGRARFRKPRDFSDGMSTTVAFGERLGRPDIAPTVVPANTFQHVWNRRVHNIGSYIPDLDNFVEECQQRPLPPGPGWQVALTYTHVTTPNQNSCMSAPLSDPRLVDQWAITASSQHVGGVHVLFVDGHTDFISDSIDTEVWRAIGTRNGNEALQITF